MIVEAKTTLNSESVKRLNKQIFKSFPEGLDALAEHPQYNFPQDTPILITFVYRNPTNNNTNLTELTQKINSWNKLSHMRQISNEEAIKERDEFDKRSIDSISFTALTKDQAQEPTLRPLMTHDELQREIHRPKGMRH